MLVSVQPCRGSRRRCQRPFRLDVEVLEVRSLPSVTTWPGFLHPVAETEPNGTLDLAQNLGDVSSASRLEVVGTLGSAPAGAVEVDWYQFQLDRPARVTLSTPPGPDASQPVTALSLYNNDPHDANDLYDPLGHRLLAQDDSVARASGASITRQLAPGTYYVAVSGSGNHYFHPYIAGSGTAGATGDYGLLVTATDLNIQPTDGPAVLAADPAANASLDRSPFLIRVDLSENLDPNTISNGTNVQLITNPNGTFGDGNDQPVQLANVNFSATANELLLAPAAPLSPGSYKVLLAGDSSTGNPVLADLSGTPLGENASHPTGADYSYTFQITGNEGVLGLNAPADDTPANAHQLGDVTQAGLVQVAGAIGVDSTDPVAFNPASVELYHFHIGGAGRFAFIGEVFAGRVGSPLDSAVSLFQVGPAANQLHLLAANDDTLDPIIASNQTIPLYTDSAVYAGLTAGDYYVAVSGGGNVPNPPSGLPGINGVFDPNVSHSGQNGYTTGNYVLNLRVQPDNLPPQVISTTPSEGAILNSPPTHVTVQFSAPVSLQPLIYEAFQQTSQNTLRMVYIQGGDGTRYFPRMLSYDQATSQASFLMLDGLANGQYQLHLSGPLGLTDFGGNPLAGNDPSGDFIVHFTVSGPARGTGGNPLRWSDQGAGDDFMHPQVLGELFPKEFQTGVTVTRDFSQDPATAPADTGDFYQIQVLQFQDYGFNLLGTNLPAGTQVQIFDASGNQVLLAPIGPGQGVHSALNPGTYVVSIGPWTTDQASGVGYNLIMRLNGLSDNPSPLLVGPAPAIGIHLVSSAPPPPAAVVTITLPAPSTPPTAAVTSMLPPAAPTATSPTALVSLTHSVPSTPAPSTSPAPGVSAPTSPPLVSVVTSTPPFSPAVTPVSGTSATPPTPAPAAVAAAPPTPPVPAASVPTSVPAPPTSPALSTVLVVALVAPSGLNGSTIPSAPGRNAPGESINSSGILLALGTTTVGGVKDPSGADVRTSDVALVRLPDLSPKQDLRLQPVLSTYTASGTGAAEAAYPATARTPGEASATGAPPPEKAGEAVHEPRGQANSVSAKMLSDYLMRMSRSWERVMDALFGATNWLEAPAQPTPDLNSPSEASPPPMNSANGEILEGMGIPADAQPLSAGDQPWTNGLAALGALAALSWDRRETALGSAPRMRRAQGQRG